MVPGTTDRKWLHHPESLVNGKVNYSVKFIGCSEVPGAKGMDMVNLALQRLKFSRHIKKAEGVKPPKVDLSISIHHVTITDVKSKIVLHRISLHRISFCADDKKDRRLFAFIAKEDSGKHNCYGFDSQTLANEITLTIGQAFELAYEKYIKTNPLTPTVQRKSAVTADEMSKKLKVLEEENRNLRMRIRQLELQKSVSVDTNTKDNIQSRPLPSVTPFSPNLSQISSTCSTNGMGTSSSKAQNSSKTERQSDTGARFAFQQPDYGIFRKNMNRLKDNQLKKDTTPLIQPNLNHDSSKKAGTSSDESAGELYANLEDIITTLKTMMDSDSPKDPKNNSVRNMSKKIYENENIIFPKKGNQQQKGNGIRGRAGGSSGSEDLVAVPNNTPNNEGVSFTPNLEALLKQHKLLMEAVLQNQIENRNQSQSTSSLDSSINAASTESTVFDTASIESSTAADCIPMGMSANQMSCRKPEDIIASFMSIQSPNEPSDYDNITRTLKQLCGEEGYMKLSRKLNDSTVNSNDGIYIDTMYDSVASLMHAVRSAAEVDESKSLQNIVAKHSSVVMPNKKVKPASPLKSVVNKPVQPAYSSIQKHKSEKHAKLKPKSLLNLQDSLDEDFHKLSVTDEHKHQNESLSEFTNPQLYRSSSSLTSDSGSYVLPHVTQQPYVAPHYPFTDSYSELWGYHPQAVTTNIWSTGNEISHHRQMPVHFEPQFKQIHNHPFLPSSFQSDEPKDSFNMAPFTPPATKKSPNTLSPLAYPSSPLSPGARRAKATDLFDLSASPATTRRNYMDAREGFNAGLSFEEGDFCLDDFDPRGINTAISSA